MNNLTRLVRPDSSQVRVDPTPKQCPSDGFNYPAFRLVNKQARVYLSQPLDTQASTVYCMYAVANSKGWFAAMSNRGSNFELILSPLEDLRSAFKISKPDEENLFVPKRRMPMTLGTPNIIAFACNDTRLLIGLEQGSILSFDTGSLFTQGSAELAFLHAYHTQLGPVRQVLPNPGAEPGLADLTAIIRADGVVELLDKDLASQGGWFGDSELLPVAVSWSPKGKHLAIGLRTGEILTYSLTNKLTPNKCIPPTSNGMLVSLTWVGPGHTFHATYSNSPDDPTYHVIMLEVKSSSVTYHALAHPFPIADRPNQSSYMISLPKWDEDASSADESKTLYVVGDACSVDLEIIATSAGQWHQQSQENPLTLPLNKSLDDPVLLALDLDLTDTENATPVMYAYLNDGSLQGWQAEYSKPYAKMINPQAISAVSMQSAAAQGNNQTNVSAFGQPDSSVFGNTGSPFGSMSSGFGQPSAIGQQSVPALSKGSPFGQSPSAKLSTNTAFPLNPSTSSPFGTLSSATTTSTFGSGSPSTFGNPPTNAFGAFSSTGATNVFGQPSFGFSTPSNPPTSAPVITREVSMTDSTPSFGDLTLGGGDSNMKVKPSGSSMFGSLTTPASNQSISAFGEKPAAGFGAFSNFNNRQSPQLATQPSKSDSSNSGFGSSSSAASTTFGQPGFAKPAFGQTGFGQPSFGKVSTPASGGFSAFASNSPASFSVPSKPSEISGGFSAFTSNAPSSFSSASKQIDSTPKGFSAFALDAPTSFASASKQADSTTSGGFNAFASSAPSFSSSKFTESKEGGFSTVVLNESPSVRSNVAASTASINEGSKSKESFVNTNTSRGSFGPSDSSGSEALKLSNEHSDKPKSESSTVNNYISSAQELATPTGTPKKTTRITTSPSSSPESLSPRDSPPPASSFQSSVPASRGSFVLKPASGFGAFGSDQVPSSSPFFKKPQDNVSKITAFSKIDSGTNKPTALADTPTFGTQTKLGAGRSTLFTSASSSKVESNTPAFVSAKSAFQVSTPLTSTTTKEPASGGFSAFSGSLSTFGAFSVPKTSFTELLQTDVDTKDPVKPTTSLKGDATPRKEVLKNDSISVFPPPSSSLTADSEISSSSDKSETGHIPVAANESAAVSVFSKHRASESGQLKGPDPVEIDKDEDTRKEGLSAHLSDVSEPSFGDLSLSSAGSSFVQVSVETSDEQESSDSDSDSDSEEHSEYLPSDESSEEAESESEESSSRSPSAEPTGIPLPPSRSPSSTPQPDVPIIKVTHSPPVSDDTNFSTLIDKMPLREVSTTPPGTPSKTSTQIVSSSSSTPSISSVGQGSGRPSTRPARSSPLASTPLSGADDDSDEDRENEDEPLAKPSISPKPAFGLLPASLKDEKPESQPSPNKRPRTPPLLSSFGAAIPLPLPKTPVLAPATPPKRPSTTPITPISSFGIQATPTSTLPFSFSAPNTTGKSSPPSFFNNSQGKAPSTALPSLFGTTPSASLSASSSSLPSSGFSMPQFNLKENSPSPPAIQPSLLQTTSSQSGIKSQSPLQRQSMQSAPDNALTSTRGLFGNMAPPSLMSPGAKSFSASETNIEEGMQKECVLLLTGLARELEELNNLAQLAKQKRAELIKSPNGVRKRSDLGDPTKWSLADMVQFGEMLRQYRQDILELKHYREGERRTLREIQSSQLKATTRREEIARFNKANSDKDFAKMLRARTLCPEHLETQTNLRRNIRVIRDRIETLESQLLTYKKKLTRASSGKPELKAPSLDTINRTYRNMDIAIRQQSDDIAQLTTRISKLDVSTPMDLPSVRDTRLPDVVERRPYNVTPHVAVTTAAALNAERSAHRLKNALLSIRKEPLLNTKAASAPLAPMAFKTPQNYPSRSPSSFVFQVPLAGPLFGSQTLETPSASVPDWTLPDDDFNPSPLPPARRGAEKVKKHSSVALRRNPGMTQPLPSPSFDWGPLPLFNNPPLTTLAAEVKLTATKSSLSK